MLQILEELWNGDITPYKMDFIPESRQKTMCETAQKHKKELLSNLNYEQKETFFKYEDLCDELQGLKEKEIFSYGFKLGLRLTVACLCCDGEKTEEF